MLTVRKLLVMYVCIIGSWQLTCAQKHHNKDLIIEHEILNEALAMSNTSESTGLSLQPSEATLPPLTNIWIGTSPIKEDVTETLKFPRLQIGTDAIGWALLQVNTEIEYDMAPHWSFTVPIYYSAWNYGSSDWKFRTFALQAEGRWWYHSDNHGLFLGIHFGMAYYDLAFGGKFRYQDHDKRRPSLGGGLGIGWRIPLDKNKKWNLTLNAGIGVYYIHYDRFLNEPNGKRIDSIKKTRLIPDRFSISFSYVIPLKREG